MRLTAIAVLVLCGFSQVSEAALIGTELGFKAVYQATQSSPEISLTSLNTMTVREPDIEIPSASALQVSNPSGLTLVNVSINAGNDFLDIDFTNSASFGGFASGFRNSYVFTFDTVATLSITSAFIDRSVTTLGLSDSDVTFVGNTLEVNVESLPFNPSTFARINLTSLNPVPIPPAVWLFGTGVAALIAMKKRKCA
jgi:hypothetical protein